jgi:hypothetical protein
MISTETSELFAYTFCCLRRAEDRGYNPASQTSRNDYQWKRTIFCHKTSGDRKQITYPISEKSRSPGGLRGRGSGDGAPSRTSLSSML